MEFKNLKTVVIDQTREYRKAEVFADLFLKEKNIAKVRILVFLTSHIWDADKGFYVKNPEFDVNLTVLVPDYNSKIGFCSAANVSSANCIDLNFAYYKQRHAGGNLKLVEYSIFSFIFNEQGNADCFKKEKPKGG